jgi:hypothetical protein
MSIRNVEIQTIGLHIGSPDHSKVQDISRTYNKAGVLTCPGISIFGDAVAGQKATVTIYPPNSESKQSYLPSLYVKGDSAFIGDIAVNGSQTITKNLTISGTMRAGFATWSSSIVATSKLFDIEHPSKGKGHRLAHASLEGPEIGVYYRGVLEDSQIINLPNYWKDLVDSKTITVHLTPIGNYQYLHYTLAENKIVVRNFGNASIHCSYIVYGERKDVERLTVEYQSDTIMEQGKPK